MEKKTHFILMQKEKLKMKRDKNTGVSFGALLVLLFSSCAGTPKMQNKVFTVMILDESSVPVKEMEVEVKSSSGKDFKIWTNEEGLFYLTGMKNGVFQINGSKEGYSDLKEKISVNDFQKIYCFQVFSADYILDEIESLVSSGRNKEALKKLEMINPGKNKNLKECISFYKKEIHKEEKNEKNDV